VITVAAWGAGLQSTAMIAMSLLGQLPPLDHAIHTDLGWERDATIRIRAWYRDWFTEHGLQVHILHTGDIRTEGANAHVHIPFWTEDGGPLRRQCTRQLKIRPMRRHVRTLIGHDPTLPPNPPAASVEQWFGITTDEWTRARKSEVQYIVNRYPLIEAGLDRYACAAWLEAHHLPVPVKSACVICPYRSASEWIEIRDTEPANYAQACTFDEAHRTIPSLRRGGSTADALYIWQGGTPLAEADLEAAASRQRRIYGTQLPLFACESGYCGN
jgi:hypothetical protein